MQADSLIVKELSGQRAGHGLRRDTTTLSSSSGISHRAEYRQGHRSRLRVRTTAGAVPARGSKDHVCTAYRSPELGVFGFGLLVDGDFGIGVLPESEEILVSGSCLFRVAGNPGELPSGLGQRPPWKRNRRQHWLLLVPSWQSGAARVNAPPTPTF